MSVRTPPHLAGLRGKLCALGLSLVAMLPSAAPAATSFSSLLDLEMSVVGGAIENKFGFATSFPRPDVPPPKGGGNGNPGGDDRKFTNNGGTANLNPPLLKDGIQRKSVANGRGLRLAAGGDTNAILVDGSIGQAERWASGVTRFR